MAFAARLAVYAFCVPLACTPAPGSTPSNDAAPSASTRAPRVAREPAFFGEDGLDPWGGPLRQPDRRAVLELLRASAFEELDRWFAFWQSEHEADPRKERYAIEAFAAFEVADPEIEALLSAWIAAAPESFAARAARGSWSTAMGWTARGEKPSAETDPEQMRAMVLHHTRATVDLERAIALRPGAVASHVNLISIAKVAGDEQQARARLDAAITACGACYEPRAMYLTALEPRWGGGYDEMDAFVATQAQAIAEHPKLARLRGFAAWDRCRTLWSSKRRPAAKRECDDALRHGDEPRFLFTRAGIARADERDAKARVDLDAALRLSPQHVDALVSRNVVRRKAGDILGAAEDLALAFEIDPLEPDVVASAEWMIAKLRYDGDQLGKAGKPEEAAPYLDLARRLAPNDKDLLNRQGWNAGEIGPEVLTRKVAEHPDDFELRLQLDHALVKTRRLAENVASWDEYLRRVPDDARAHRERAGAKWQLGEREAGVDDMQRACDLGDATACTDVPRMRARLAR